MAFLVCLAGSKAMTLGDENLSVKSGMAPLRAKRALQGVAVQNQVAD